MKSFIAMDECKNMSVNEKHSTPDRYKRVEIFQKCEE